MTYRSIGAFAALAVFTACGGGEPAENAPAAEPATPAATAAATATVDLTGVALPEGVTAEMVNAGATAWPTQACIACHGTDGHGAPGLGPDLTDGIWLHSDGTFQAIRDMIVAGVPQPKEAAAPMLPFGGAQLDDAMVDNLAAYIWAVSHTSE